MRNAVAFANNDVATIAWSYGAKPDGCMGFAVYRVDSEDKETALPSHAVFKGQKIADGQTTAEFPIQKFYWRDPYARLVGAKTGNMSFRYKIVPLEGTPEKLVPMKSLPILTTNEVELTAKCSDNISVVFNRGIISTQHVSKAIDGKYDPKSFIKTVSVETNQLREDLAGDMIGALTGFLARAKLGGGTIYAALYELTDSELIRNLVGTGAKLEIVMADIAGEPVGKTVKEPQAPENQEAWEEISKSAKVAAYRLPPSGHIVHNKFLIYVDKTGPQAVLSGSCNWTTNALCAQTNNAFIIDDPKVAKRYFDYWTQLKADEDAHEANSMSFQASALRKWNAKGQDFKLDDGSTLSSYFSPNTSKARGKKGANEAVPVDMKDLSDRVMHAKQAVLFLAFIPGTPSITDFAADAQKANKELFVRGCVTSPDAAGDFYYILRGTSPPKKQRAVPGQPKPPKVTVKQDARVIAAEALDKKKLPEGWLPELLKAGFAITHDKIVVIDPFSDDCCVIAGSHNLGYQASYNNDENLIMVEGNRNMAMAYATHVLDVYDHFSWRWAVKRGDQTPDAYLKSTPDEWLDWYFDAQGRIKTQQLKFWMQATV